MPDNANLARNWFQKVWNERCEDTICNLMAAHAVAQMPAGPIQGVEQFKKFRAELLEAFPDMSVTIHDTVAEDDKVVTWWKVKATHTGTFAGIEKTDLPVEFSGMSWFRFENGQLVEGFDSWDTGGLIHKLQMAAKK